MTTTMTENLPGPNEQKAVSSPGFSDDVILNEWLSSNPAPGTYNEYRKTYFALRRGKP